MYGGNETVGEQSRKQESGGSDRYEVIVPVFLKVTLDEADDLAAEVVAEEIVAGLGVLNASIEGRGVTIEVQSVLKTTVVKEGGTVVKEGGN